MNKNKIAIHREIDLFESYLCGGDKSYPAYESDPVEANLHELGHAFAALGIHGALRTRDLNGPIDISKLCKELSDPVGNEYEAIAFTFLVARSIGHKVDEKAITRDANVPTFSKSAIAEINKSEVAKALSNSIVQKLAKAFVRTLYGA